MFFKFRFFLFIWKLSTKLLQRENMCFLSIFFLVFHSTYFAIFVDNDDYSQVALELYNLVAHTITKYLSSANSIQIIYQITILRHFFFFARNRISYAIRTVPRDFLSQFSNIMQDFPPQFASYSDSLTLTNVSVRICCTIRVLFHKSCSQK